MMSPAHVIAQHLSDSGLGTLGADDGWSIAVAREPAAPDNTLTIYDTGGSDPLLYDDNLRQPSIQVRVRAFDYRAAYAKTSETIDAMHAIIDAVIDGMHYVHVEMTGDVQSLGADDNDRHQMTANFTLIREPAEATHG